MLHSLLSLQHYCHLMAIVPVIVICYPPLVIGRGEDWPVRSVIFPLGWFIDFVLVMVHWLGLGGGCGDPVGCGVCRGHAGSVGVGVEQGGRRKAGVGGVENMLLLSLHSLPGSRRC